MLAQLQDLYLPLNETHIFGLEGLFVDDLDGDSDLGLLIDGSTDHSKLSFSDDLLLVLLKAGYLDIIELC